MFLKVPTTLNEHTLISMGTFIVLAGIGLILWFFQYKKYLTFHQRVFLD